MVVLHGAPCLGVEEERPVVSRTEYLPGLLRRRCRVSLEHRQHVASDNILEGERITGSKCLGAGAEFPAVRRPDQGIGNPHLAARKLDHTRQHERGTEFGPRLFDGIDPRLAYLTRRHHLKVLDPELRQVTGEHHGDALRVEAFLLACSDHPEGQHRDDLRVRKQRPAHRWPQTIPVAPGHGHRKEADQHDGRRSFQPRGFLEPAPSTVNEAASPMPRGGVRRQVRQEIRGSRGRGIRRGQFIGFRTAVWRRRSNCGQQFLLHGAGASRPAGRIAIERSPDHLNDARGQVRSQIADGRGALVGVRAFELGDGTALERIAHRQQVVEQNAYAVDIAGHGRRLAAQHLGRQVKRCAGGPPQGIGLIRPHFAGPEVHEHDSAAGLAHDVLRLDIAMDEPRLVYRRHRTAQVRADEGRLVRAEHAALMQRLLEREAVDEFHPQAHGAFELVHPVHNHDVRMPDARKQTAFADDGRRALRSLENLQRDFSLEARIPRQMDRSEAPFPDRATQLERTPRRWYGRWVLLLLHHGIQGAAIRRAVNGGHGRQYPQLLDEFPHLGVRRRCEFLGPVHGRAVHDGPGKAHQTCVVS